MKKEEQQPQQLQPGAGQQQPEAWGEAGQPAQQQQPGKLDLMSQQANLVGKAMSGSCETLLFGDEGFGAQQVAAAVEAAADAIQELAARGGPALEAEQQLARDAKPLAAALRELAAAREAAALDEAEAMAAVQQQAVQRQQRGKRGKKK